MDMLLIGNGCVTAAEEEAQMAVWSIMASPLIMGNDVRTIKGDRARQTLLNRDAIGVSQDKMGKAGTRLTQPKLASTGVELWARALSGGNVAVALLNKDAVRITFAFSLLSAWVGYGRV